MITHILIYQIYEFILVLPYRLHIGDLIPQELLDEDTEKNKLKCPHIGEDLEKKFYEDFIKACGHHDHFEFSRVAMAHYDTTILHVYIEPHKEQ